MSTHIGDAWRAAGLLPIAMAVQCTGSIAPGPGRIRDFRHRLLAAAGIEIDADTATPSWGGERLDLDWTMHILWRPRCEPPAQ